MYFVAVESINQLQKDLETAREAQRYAESHREADYRALTRSHEERDKLKAENGQQAQEIQSLKAQLALSQEEKRKLEAGMFGECDPALLVIGLHALGGDMNHSTSYCSSADWTPRRGS
jgi:hypothetical protein